jgi:hypothetical protein
MLGRFDYDISVSRLLIRMRSQRDAMGTLVRPVIALIQKRQPFITCKRTS